MNSTRLQLISGCIFIQLNQAPPWQGVDLVDGEYEIYAVPERQCDSFAQSCRILLGFSTGDFGRRCAVERGFIPIYIICVTFGDAPLDIHNLVLMEVIGSGFVR